MIEPGVVWKQMYCTEECTSGIVGTFRSPGRRNCAPRYAPVSGKCCSIEAELVTNCSFKNTFVCLGNSLTKASLSKILKTSALSLATEAFAQKQERNMKVVAESYKKQQRKNGSLRRNDIVPSENASQHQERFHNRVSSQVRSTTLIFPGNLYSRNLVC